MELVQIPDLQVFLERHPNFPNAGCGASNGIAVVGSKVMERALQRRFPRLRPRIEQPKTLAGQYLLSFDLHGAVFFERIDPGSTLGMLSSLLLTRGYMVRA